MSSPVAPEQLFDALRTSWTRSTSADPDRWSATNPARGQCDVTSLVVLEHLGGDLRLGRVFVGGEQTEHHYWNVLASGEVIDLTSEQFGPEEVVRDAEVVTGAFVRANYPDMKPDIRQRLAVLRRSTAARLGTGFDPAFLGHDAEVVRGAA
ncbi:MAG: hypothetical protein S0880_18610 [Actinomycetota bacterium]|nr:hypothetical protein [Actinomycetota bacterium]